MLWGNYFHKGQDPEDRAKIFREFGYETLVVWVSDLYHKPGMVLAKIEKLGGRKSG